MFLSVPLAVATLRLTMNEKPSLLVIRTQSLSLVSSVYEKGKQRCVVGETTDAVVVRLELSRHVVFVSVVVVIRHARHFPWATIGRVCSLGSTNVSSKGACAALCVCQLRRGV